MERGFVYCPGPCQLDPQAPFHMTVGPYRFHIESIDTTHMVCFRTADLVKLLDDPEQVRLAIESFKAAQ